MDVVGREQERDSAVDVVALLDTWKQGGWLEGGRRNGKREQEEGGDGGSE